MTYFKFHFISLYFTFPKWGGLKPRELKLRRGGGEGLSTCTLTFRKAPICGSLENMFEELTEKHDLNFPPGPGHLYFCFTGQFCQK